MGSSRNYGIDLLRIISMFMIVILHILGQGGVLDNLEVLSLKYNLTWLLEICCCCGVNCYALITGYVMINSKFKYSKIFKLWMGVLFWSVLLTTVLKFIYPNMVNQLDFLSAFLNVTYGSYWYFSAYFALFFFIPFINKLIMSLTKKDYTILIITIVVLMSFINLPTDTFRISYGYSFMWLLCLYFIGAYIKIFKVEKKINKLYILVGIFLSLLLTFIIKLMLVSRNINNNMLAEYNSFTILFIAVGLLLIFANYKIDNKYFKRIIEILAPATFGVYIIHCQPVVFRIIMGNLFVFLTEYSTLKMVFMVLLFSFIIYMICSILEMFRIFLFNKLKIYKLVDIIFNRISEVLKL